ncbi:uncharacterized protein LOC106664143 isoform X2 [Cimex lectularius]|nr:uncharacterized protein LOC106664143 isoform X2 [Cimex lectularius]
MEENRADCSDDALYACAYPSELRNLRFTKSLQELEEMCRKFHEGLRCINEYAARCLKPHQRAHFNTLYSGTSMVMHDLCTPGPYQTEFLKHVACMSNVTDQYEHCARVYQDSVNGAMSETYSEGDKRIQKICCSLSEYLSCSKSVVRATCGEESETFAGGVLDKMSSSIKEAHCNNFTSTTCGRGSLRFISHYLIVFVLFLQLFY